MNNILLTGTDGFIESHLTEELSVPHSLDSSWFQ